MRKIMVLQHVSHEPLGTLDPMLKQAGFRIRYVNFARTPDAVPSLDSYSGLIILGGPMGVNDFAQHPHLKIERILIEEALRRDIPILGICLGAQLIASVLGGSVEKAPRWEMGWCEIALTAEGQKDGLFKDYQSEEKIFQLHQDTFSVPQSSIHLAESDLCPGQAFRYGEKVYGLQFHLEADEPMILRWFRRPENKQLILDSKGLLTAESLVTDTHNYIQRSLELSRQSFSKFIEIFNLPERPVLLGSGHGKPSKLKS